MNNLMVDIKEDLIRKYNYRAFMYIEYPHKSFWSNEFGQEDFMNGLKGLFSNKKDNPLMLYVHIPFCRKQCFYCTCHTVITGNYKKMKEYLDYLVLEIDLFAKFFAENGIVPNFKEIHLGGGSPTILEKKEFDLLINKLESIVDLKSLNEFSIEVDPREVNKEKMVYYHKKGINRISFGVQDFNHSVQKAVNRIQPYELIENLITPDIRQYFSNGINFDIICGLPNQTSESIIKTFNKVVELSPDRICFNYLHYSPKFARHQKFMTDGRSGRPTSLPDFSERKKLFCEGMNILLNNGYIRTGYDHFAKSDDSVAKALNDKTMHWNALGVTAGRYFDIIGVGLHSYSTIANYYSQNVYLLPEYAEAVSNSRFPIYRGHKLNKDDLIRRDVIQILRKFFYLDFGQIEEKYNIEFREYFKVELDLLKPFMKDGIVELFDTNIKITGLGQQFTDIVCSSFDGYIDEVKKNEGTEHS